ncbi:MAG TPA: hypothetical protein VGO16_11925 [Pseudonocardiaceae bacterium]|jgi:hypothetical protein|nr:hypothetical protein [Pseudonocardiaceae bacterium]
MRSDGIDKAIRIQHSVVANHVQRIRRRHPDATPGEIVAALEKKYVATVTSTGAAVGAAAAAPRIGPAVALALTVAESTALLEATALFTLAVADVHGMPVHDTERRRMLLLAIVFGTGGPGLASSGKRIRRWLVARYVTKRWILAISKILPFGIGAAIGAASNRAYGRMVVTASRQVFGPVPPTAAPAISDAAISDVAPLTIAEHRPAAPAPVALTNGQAPAPAAVQVPAAGQAPVADQISAAAPVTGKYRPLFHYLAARDSDHVEIAFSEIHQMVPGGLPKSASAQRSWWGNSPGRVQAKAWLAAGYEVTDVDLAAMTVRFNRRNSLG